jgi:hypothetical protein
MTHLVQADAASRQFYKALFLGTGSPVASTAGGGPEGQAAASADSSPSSPPSVVRIDRSAYAALVDLVVSQMLQQLHDGGLKRYASELVFALCDEDGKQAVRTVFPWELKGKTLMTACIFGHSG